MEGEAACSASWSFNEQDLYYIEKVCGFRPLEGQSAEDLLLVLEGLVPEGKEPKESVKQAAIVI